MAIRAALYVAGWLPFALVTIIKMHYSPLLSILVASSVSIVSSLPGCNWFFSFGRRASHLFLLPSLFRWADRSFGYLLFMSRRTPPLLLALSLSFSFGLPASLPYTSCTPVMLAERKREEEPLLPLPLFNLSSPLLKSAELFTHRRAHACLDSIKDERFDIWLTLRQACTCTKYRNIGTLNFENLPCLISIFFSIITLSTLPTLSTFA